MGTASHRPFSVFFPKTPSSLRSGRAGAIAAEQPGRAAKRGA